MVKKLLVTGIIFLFHCATYAQNSERLLLGEKVPSISFRFYDQPAGSFTLHDYKGKLIIIDFWATWCTSCIKKFPMLDSLQGTLKDKIQILLVNSKGTGDVEKDLEKFLQGWKDKQGKEFRLPIIFNDTVFEKLFKHRIVPQFIWIAPDGTLLAETTGEFLNKETIEMILSSRTSKKKVKQ